MKDVAQTGWGVRPLGEVLQVLNGYAFKSKQFSETEGTPLIRIRDLKAGSGTVVNFVGEYDPQYVVDDGDLLIGMDGEFRCHEWQGGKALLNQRVCKLTGFAEEILPRFLYYGINKYLKEIEDRTAYTTVKHLSSKTIKSIDFPLPPLKEQQRIVAVLDEAFEGLARARAHAEANLKNARDMFESFIERNVAAPGGCEFLKLAELADVVSGYSFSSGDFASDNPVKSIKITNVGLREFVEADTARLPKSHLSQFERFSVPEGSIVIALTRTIISGGLKVAIVPKSFSGALLNQRVAALKVSNDNSLRDYLYLFLSSSVVAKYVQDKANTLMQPNLSINDLKALPIPNLDGPRQKDIVERAACLREQVSELQAQYQSRLRDLDDLRQSLLQKAFAGELT